MPANRRHIVIVGGGFSGVALAAQLLRGAGDALRITLIEAGDRIGRGLAYGTAVDAHLLNAAADQMSLYQDDPAHFLRWAQSAGVASAGTDFVPRLHYGRYLEDTLQFAARASEAHFEFLLSSRVADVMRGLAGWIVQLADGRRFACDEVVLATGNPAPADPLAGWLHTETPRYLRDPWAPGGLDGVGPDEKILLIGTGLTMIDVLLTLERRGHSGSVHAISRRGLLPRAHPLEREALPEELKLPLLAELPGLSLRGLLRAVRRTMAAAVAQGFGPQVVIDAMRPVVPALWAALPARERGRFLRHLRPYWDAIRHRAAPQVAAIVGRMLSEGRLTIGSGRLSGALELADGIVIWSRANGGDEQKVQYDRVVNCTGPAFAKDGGTLLDRVLIARGLISADAQRLGRRSDSQGAALDGTRCATGLYILGPACRARDWELTAVPELRRAAERLAATLAVDDLTSKAASYPDLLHHSLDADHFRRSIA